LHKASIGDCLFNIKFTSRIKKQFVMGWDIAM
jgi:hypothetical protein